VQSKRIKKGSIEIKMRAVYRITAEEIGTVILRRRKIVKALKRWLRENNIVYESSFYLFNVSLKNKN